MPPSEREFTGSIRQALRDELGGSRAAAKSIMRWTGVSDRTARNWLNGAASPRGYHLVCLHGCAPAQLAHLVRRDAAVAVRVEVAEHADEGRLRYCVRGRGSASRGWGRRT